MRAGLFVIALVVLSGCSVFEWLGQSGDMRQETGIQEANSAANADVTFVRAVQNGDTWTFHVTVAHPDTGWEDYADGWDVVLPDGTVIKPDAESPFTRLLLHPHENEQPFTRSQSRIIIPEGITQVTVRAHDLVDGFGGQKIVVDFMQTAGDSFEVVRETP